MRSRVTARIGRDRRAESLIKVLVGVTVTKADTSINPSTCVVHMVDAHPKHLLSVVDLTEMSLAAWLRGRRPA